MRRAEAELGLEGLKPRAAETRPGLSRQLSYFPVLMRQALIPGTYFKLVVVGKGGLRPGDHCIGASIS